MTRTLLITIAGKSSEDVTELYDEFMDAICDINRDRPDESAGKITVYFKPKPELWDQANV